MDTGDDTLESKCENLMNIVVESRKRLRKSCIAYDQKVLVAENKLLNLQVLTAANYRFKPKNAIPSIDEESYNHLDDFLVEIAEKRRRIDDLFVKLRNTREVISQLETGGIGKRLRAPLTAEDMLAQARAKEAV